MEVALLFVGRVQHYYAESYQTQILQSLRCQGFQTIDVFLSHNGNNINDPLQQFVKDYHVTQHESVILHPSQYEHILIPVKEGVYNYNSITMFYHMHRVYQMAAAYQQTHQRKYKAIIYLRADAHFEDPLILPSSLQPNAVYIPTIPTQSYINDQFAYGTPESMATLCSLFSHLHSYVHNDHISILPETMYQHHINTQKLTVQSITLRYQLNPHRRNGTWYVHPNAGKPQAT